MPSWRMTSLTTPPSSLALSGRLPTSQSHQPRPSKSSAPSLIWSTARRRRWAAVVHLDRTPLHPARWEAVLRSWRSQTCVAVRPQRYPPRQLRDLSRRDPSRRRARGPSAVSASSAECSGVAGSGSRRGRRRRRRWRWSRRPPRIWKVGWKRPSLREDWRLGQLAPGWRIAWATSARRRRRPRSSERQRREAAAERGGERGG
mmetsp:Transcript_20537/g.45848  ORF Transcript_20537/g.45848 Transcript_20537/m.45848 type:complete len:202 (+) Transcript_20537:909-1514(+)